MRRRHLLELAAIAAFAAGLAVGSGAGDPDRPSAGAEPGAAGAAGFCEDPSTPLRHLAGGRVVVRMQDAAPASLLRAARSGSIGGVILFPGSDTPPRRIRSEVARLQRSAAAGGHEPLVVAIDQEGGSVRRLDAAPPLAGAAEVGARDGPAAVRRLGRRTGRALLGAGVNVNLAPVLDVPAAGARIAPRAYSADPRAAARLGGAFARGLADAGVMPTAKHFPGLGRALASTDREPVAIHAPARELRTDLLPFRRVLSDGRIPIVMIANASYPKLGADGPASTEPAVARHLLRARLGFEGVSITDDLHAAAVARVLSPSEAAVAATAAGADLLLFAAGEPPPARRLLVRAVRLGIVDEARLRESCRRVAELRRRLPRPGG